MSQAERGPNNWPSVNETQQVVSFRYARKAHHLQFRLIHLTLYPALLTQIEAGGSKLFAASATNSFHCLNAEDGSVVWSSSFGPSIHLSSSKYSETHNVVYSIQVRVDANISKPTHSFFADTFSNSQHLTGKVVQHDASTGEVNWHIDCVNITSSPICMDSVEAESR